jgi:hypothetical protein
MKPANSRNQSRPRVVDSLFHRLFTFLFCTMGVLLCCQAVIRAYGQTVFLILFIVTVIVCLELKNWAARVATAIFIFAVLPVSATYVWNNTSPVVMFLVLVVLSVGAYFIREGRLEQRPPPLKTHGAERTPIFPPGSETE